MKKPLLFLGITISLFIGIWAVDEFSQAETNPIVEQTEPIMPVFKPIRKEFKLDNGTPCVMVWAPNHHSAGTSCDWDYKKRQEKQE